MTEIRERDLRFTTEEAAAFLTQTMGLRLSTEVVRALEARTEGWIAGLQLAALALQEDQGDVEDREYVRSVSERIMQRIIRLSQESAHRLETSRAFAPSPQTSPVGLASVSTGEI